MRRRHMKAVLAEATGKLTCISGQGKTVWCACTASILCFFFRQASTPDVAPIASQLPQVSYNDDSPQQQTEIETRFEMEMMHSGVWYVCVCDDGGWRVQSLYFIQNANSHFHRPPLALVSLVFSAETRSNFVWHRTASPHHSRSILLLLVLLLLASRSADIYAHPQLFNSPK